MGIAERRSEQGDADDAPVGDYDDPTAVLAGEWGRNQHARGTVFSRNPTDEYFQEVELRLRSTMTPHSCTGYEVFWRCLKTEAGYAEIVRWDGKIGSWKSLARKQGPRVRGQGRGPGRGDHRRQRDPVVHQRRRGAVRHGRHVRRGQPRGSGSTSSVGNTYVDHGFRHFEVDTYGD